MLIGIEASRANRPKKTGVEWYAYHLIQELKRLPEAEPHSWLLYGNTPLAHGLEKGPRNWHERQLSWPPKYLWTQARLTLEMLVRKPEVLFVPAHVLPRVIPRKTVVTIHDVGFHRFPQLYTKKQLAYHEWSTRDILNRAERVITVSGFSKQELMDVYQADPDKIFVTHLAIDHHRFYPRSVEETERILAGWEIPDHFLMFVGRLERKKNLTTLLEAFRLYKEWAGEDDPLELVLVGQPGVGYEEIERLIQLHPANHQVQLVGYVTEEEKAALLSRATALVHPSWYEGFGLPPLEAMACGCPVICSRGTSLPEVVGIENALWFDPADAQTLAVHIDHIAHDDSTHIELQQRGLWWVRRYTWEETARQTLRLLTEW